MSDGNNATNNYFQQFRHHCLDTLNTNPSPQHRYFINNTCVQITATDGGSGTYSRNSSNITFSNNYFYGLNSNIGVDGGVDSKNINFTNNYFGDMNSASTDPCIAIDGREINVINNIFGYCNNNGEIRDVSGKILYKDNTFSNPLIRILMTSGSWTNITINQTSTSGILINYSGYLSGQNSTINLLYNGNKDINIQGTIVTATSLPSLNSYCNSTVSACSEVNNFTETLGSGKRSFVVGYDTETQPKVYSAETTASIDLFQLSGNNLVFNKIGTGNIVVNNLNNAREPYQYYVIYLGNEALTYLSGDDVYTFVTVGRYNMYGTGMLPIDFVTTYSTFIKTVLSLLVSLIMLSIIIIPVVKFREDWGMNEWLYWMIASIIVIVINLVVINMIANM
jgi:hypothetical protein